MNKIVKNLCVGVLVCITIIVFACSLANHEKPLDPTPTTKPDDVVQPEETEGYQKIMNIQPTWINPNVSQQSIATDGEFVYVLYPSDKGTKKGAVQVYSKDGWLVRTFFDIPTGHASSTAYHDGNLYVLGFKKKSKTMTLLKVDVMSGKYTQLDVKMGEKMVWDGFNILDGVGYAIGFDRTALISKKQPKKVVIQTINMEDLSIIKTIKCELPSHTHWTTQGVVAYGNDLYALVSESDGKKKPQKGMCIDRYDLTSGMVNSEIIPADLFWEPEGAMNLDGYLCTSLIGRKGIYQILNLEE